MGSLLIYCIPLISSDPFSSPFRCRIGPGQFVVGRSVALIACPPLGICQGGQALGGRGGPGALGAPGFPRRPRGADATSSRAVLTSATSGCSACRHGPGLVETTPRCCFLAVSTGRNCAFRASFVDSRCCGAARAVGSPQNSTDKHVVLRRSCAARELEASPPAGVLDAIAYGWTLHLPALPPLLIDPGRSKALAKPTWPSKKNHKRSRN